MMRDIVLDWGRRARTGLPEAVFCEGKSDDQIARIVSAAEARGERLLLTRLAAERFASLPADLRGLIDFDAASRTGLVGQAPDPVDLGVGLVFAGSSDRPVAEEARRTLLSEGVSAKTIGDIGVAGLWRLIDRVPELADRRVVIAVAGMEGALFSVLAGLVPAPVIAVPTSVGYCVAEGGKAALSTALASCAPGIVTVNIDNGYGAAAAALKILRAASPRQQEDEETP
jgi:pyridinium-3,5-biscarboxylic acid mononucleotide synthase